MGRFLQTDPVGPRPEEMNAYVYVRNNPVNDADPTGEGKKDCALFAYYSKECAKVGLACKERAQEAAKRTGCLIDEKNLYESCFVAQPDCQNMLKYGAKCSGSH